MDIMGPLPETPRGNRYILQWRSERGGGRAGGGGGGGDICPWAQG